MLDIYEISYKILSLIQERKAMNSIQKECTGLKQKYDACYSVWFTDRFLKGGAKEDACAPLFELYQQCLKKSMKEHNIHLKDVLHENFELEKDVKTNKK